MHSISSQLLCSKLIEQLKTYAAHADNYLMQIKTFQLSTESAQPDTYMYGGNGLGGLW